MAIAPDASQMAAVEETAKLALEGGRRRFPPPTPQSSSLSPVMKIPPDPPKRAAAEKPAKLAGGEGEAHPRREGIYRHYGFDFRDYSLPSLRRRIWKRVYAEG